MSYKIQQMVQQVRASTASVITCSTVINFDNTIPQNTEGDEVITVAITPTTTTTILVIEFDFFGTPSGSLSYGAAIFQDSTAGALWAGGDTAPAAGNVSKFAGTHYLTSGTTSSTTFKLRVGVTSNTFYVNGDNVGTRYFGGVGVANLIVTEYAT
jgi:hypothetical protein